MYDRLVMWIKQGAGVNIYSFALHSRAARFKSELRTLQKGKRAVSHYNSSFLQFEKQLWNLNIWKNLLEEKVELINGYNIFIWC